jgi:hypothetical protein
MDDDEKQLEQTALAEVKEDEVRKSVVSEFGFNEETDKEKIEKAVAREMGPKKALNTAIRQKISHRTSFEEYKKSNPPKADPPPSDKKKDDGVDLDKKFNEEFEKRDLDAMEYPDDIKKVIQNAAKLNDISVRKAVSDPYVAAKIESWKKQKEADEAALSRNNNSGGTDSGDFSVPPEVDLSTKEGREKYDQWKKGAIAEEKKQFKY